MTEWLTEILNGLGLPGIVLLLALARLIPPLPAEAVVPLAGTAAEDLIDLAGVALAGGLGSTLGELCWYLPGRLLGRERLREWLERHGHWLTVTPKQVDRAGRWFERHGGWAVMLAQPVPGVRNLVCIPAGACGQPWPLFLLASAAGSVFWVFVLAGAGYLARLGLPGLVDYVGAFTLALCGVLIGVYLYRLVRQLRKRRGGRERLEERRQQPEQAVS